MGKDVCGKDKVLTLSMPKATFLFSDAKFFDF